jgi:asparagine synthase (glutamine-hydrolysing)
MCGIVGFVNFSKDISNDKYIINKMNDTLGNRGPNEDGYFSNNNVLLGHKRLIVIDPEGGKQPMSATFNSNKYTIVYNGQIYNANDLRSELIENGFDFEGHCDTEVLLKSYIHWGYAVTKKLNGIFAFGIWDHTKQELFIARDHFGIKPFYFTEVNNNFIFASEIKAILEHPEVTPEIDSNGISELLGLGPAHTPGTCVFKHIFELKPANFRCI